MGLFWPKERLRSRVEATKLDQEKKGGSDWFMVNGLVTWGRHSCCHRT